MTGTSPSSKTNEDQFSSEQDERQPATTTTEEEKHDESDEKNDECSNKRSLDHQHEDNKGDSTSNEDNCDPKSKKAKLVDSDNTNTKKPDAPLKSVFGSGFSAFKPTGTTSGFGFGSTSNSASFGSGAAPGKLVFGQIGTSKTNGFGSSTNQNDDKNASGFGSSNTAFKPFTKGFGSSNDDNNNDDNQNITATASTTTSVFAKTEVSVNESEEPTFTPIVHLPQSSEEIKNGEENEESILSLRAKLFKLTKVVVTSNVPAEASSPTQAKVGGIQMATKVGVQMDENEKTQNQESTTDSTSDHKKIDWKEVGIGPLRILTDDKHVRIVQRRETTPGGQGTKLILNIRLREECRVERQADKFVKLAAFEAVDTSSEEKEIAKKFEMVQYLFKVKTVAEGDALFETLKKYCKSK
jgi:hypothetical protein